MNSPEFARLWAGHDVRLCTSGAKRFRHPEVGELELGLRGAAPARGQRATDPHPHRGAWKRIVRRAAATDLGLVTSHPTDSEEALPG